MIYGVGEAGVVFVPKDMNALQCTPWGYCTEAGKGGKYDNLIGSAAYTIACSFGKNPVGCANYVQTNPGYGGIGQYMPLILLAGGGVLLFSIMTRR